MPIALTIDTLRGIDELCSEAALEKGLTPRESEVLPYLAKGYGSTASHLLLVKSAKHKTGAPQGASIIFSRIRYFFSAFAAGRTGFSLSRCMLM